MTKRPTFPLDDGERAQSSRRQFITAASAAGLGLTAGCLGGGQSDSATKPINAESVPPKNYEQTVNVWNWYYSWRDWVVAEFQEETEISVNKGDYTSGSEFYAKLKSGNHKIDNVGSTVNWTNRAMKNGYLSPLPVDKMESWQQMPEYVKESTRKWKGQDGDIYAIPQAVSIYPTLTYNTDTFGSAPESWDVLWNDEYEGQIFMWDAPVLSGQIAAMYTGQDPFEPDDFDDIKEALIQQKPLLKTYWSSYNQARGMFVNEDVVVGPLLDGQTWLAKFQDGASIDMTVPKEGSFFNVDDIIIPKGAPHPMASLYFVDFAMQPENAKQLLLTMGYLPPIKQENIMDIYSQELESGKVTKEQLEFYQWPQEWEDRLKFGKPVSEEVRNKYSEIWTQVKAA